MNTAYLFIWSSTDDLYVVIDDTRLDLPRLDVPPSNRLPSLVRQWCRARRVAASFITTIGGVGRANGSVDWGIWARLNGPLPGTHFAPLSKIATAAQNESIRRLAQALIAVRCAPATDWIGFNPMWPEIVQAWIGRTQRAQPVGTVVPLRSQLGHIVASSWADGQPVFFTARKRPFDDVEISDALEAHSPGTTPRTLGYHRSRGWWLTAAVRASELTAHVDHDGHRQERLAKVMTGMGGVQISTAGSTDLQRLSCAVSYESVRGGVQRALEHTDKQATWTVMARAATLVGVEGLWKRAHADEAVRSWIHSDPSPDNVRIDECGRLAFIDFEDPWYGPSPLMGALALQSLGHRCRWDDRHKALCLHAWHRYLGAFDLTPERYELDDWLKLAQLVHLIRGVDKTVTGRSLLLYEETPRRARAMARELQRLCAP